MKKPAVIIISAILLVSLCACGHQQIAVDPVVTPPQPVELSQTAVAQPVPAQNDESRIFTFPEGTVICGADVSGMIRPEAYRAICQALSNYSIDLTVNGTSFTFSGSELLLTCPETATVDLVSAMQRGEDPAGIDLITYDDSVIRQSLEAALNTPAKNAAIFYNSAVGSFQLSKDIPGVSVDVDAVMAQVQPAIEGLNKEVSVMVAQEAVMPDITANGSKATQALANANAYLDISLTYSFTPDGRATQLETISKDTIASFITFDKDLNAAIDTTVLGNYVLDLSDKYSAKSKAGLFKTSDGDYVDVCAEYSSQPLNVSALYEDIYNCITNGISGNRVAPYLVVVESNDLAFGGNYVEIDLSAQFLWVYNEGVCVVATPIVSGCADCRNYTPTGVYNVYYKTTNTYLVGTGYRSWVNYWMPFYRGYGLHDANWRNAFGGDNYLHNGSHGCVNIPPAYAGHVYNNVIVGTPVIIYGGATRSDLVPQYLTGTAEYVIPQATQPFKLDVQPGMGDNKTLTYTSSNPAVATVAADGTVQVNGLGTTYITVTAPARQYYTSAQMIVKITVYDGCPVNIHAYSPWILELEATCTTDGYFTATCSLCGHIEYYEVKATGHTFGEWEEVLAPTCTQDGLKSRACITCGETETEIIPTTGHNVDSWDITESTCKEPGSKSGTCSICSEIITEEIPTKAHDFSSGGPFCDYGCGTPNPDYLPPKDDEDETQPEETEPIA